MSHLRVVEDEHAEFRAASDRDPTRSRSTRGVDEIFAELIATQPKLTDEEWAARDAEVAAKRAAMRVLEPPRSTKRSRFDELEESGFPRRALRNVRQGAMPPPAIESFRDVPADDFGVLVLSGAQGVGKTTCAAWIAHARTERWRFIHASDLLAMSRFEKDDRAERALLYSAPLVVDDLGAEPADAKGNFAADIDRLIDVFYSQLRPLIITTNMPLVVKSEDGGAPRYPFPERYGPRAGDRLRESGTWQSMAGKSLRRRPNKEGQ